MIITETKAGFEVAFKYDPIKVAALRRITGSYFLPERKVWVVNRGHRNDLMRLVARFTKPAPTGDYSAMPAQVELMEKETIVVDKTMPKLTVSIPLKGELREYQKDGVAYNMIHKNVLNGDQQGLGKSLTSIASVVAQNAFPCLVLCKSSLTRNWSREWSQWTEKQAIVLKDSVKSTWPVFFQTGAAQIAICSYDSMAKYFVQNLNKPKEGKWMVKDIEYRQSTTIFKSVIVDESHLVKNPDAIRTKLVVGLCKKRDMVYLLSGTPVLNDPVELYPQLVALGVNHHFGSMEKFKALYGKQNKRQKEALPLLNYLLHKHCYFRRTKSEVAIEIPPKTREVVLVDIDNRKEYDLAEHNFKKFLEDKLQFTKGQIDQKLRAEALIKIMELKKLAARGKLHAVYEWIDDLVAEDEKFVLFGFHKEITEQLAKHHPATVRLCASADPDTLQRRKEKFQTDPETKGIVCSIMADAEGHTLTAASNVGLVELPWHFGKAEQMEDRCIAGGQLIMTREGFKKIEDVKVGDEVWSASGFWRKVLAAWSKVEKKECFVSIKYKGFDRPLVVTESHPVFVYDKMKDEFEYIEANKIHPLRHMMVLANPYPDVKQPLVTHIDLEIEYGGNTITRAGNERPTNRVKNPVARVELTKELMFAFGWYLAEGWCDVAKTREKGSTVSVCGNSDTETEIVQSVCNTFIDSFKLDNSKPSFATSKNHCHSGRIYSKNLAHNFMKWFGSGSTNKKIPDFVKNCEPELIREFLSGYYAGDGYERKHTQQATTASDKLAIGLCHMESLFNRPVTLRTSVKGPWSFEYFKSEQSTVAPLIKNKHNSTLFPIQEISMKRPTRHNQTVYDLTVEHDHSFTVGLAAVHNCHRIGTQYPVTISYFLGDNTVDRKIYDLIMEKKEMHDMITGTDEEVEEKVVDKLINLFNQK